MFSCVVPGVVDWTETVEEVEVASGPDSEDANLPEVDTAVGSTKSDVDPTVESFSEYVFPFASSSISVDTLVSTDDVVAVFVLCVEF